MGSPYPWDKEDWVHLYHWFEVNPDGRIYTIYDRHMGFKSQIEAKHLQNENFDMAGWYQKCLFALLTDTESGGHEMAKLPQFYIADLFDGKQLESEDCAANLEQIQALASSSKDLTGSRGRPDLYSGAKWTADSDGLIFFNPT